MAHSSDDKNPDRGVHFNLLVTVADGQAPTGTKVATEQRIARSTLQDALERLVADERHLHRDANGKFRRQGLALVL